MAFVPVYTTKIRKAKRKKKKKAEQMNQLVHLANIEDPSPFPHSTCVCDSHTNTLM